MPQSFSALRASTLCWAVGILFFAAVARAAIGVWENTGGPIGGLGYNIRIHPTNKNIMFQTDAFSGVHRSTDGGQTWVEANSGIDARTGPSNDAIPVFSLTIDARNPSIVWVGTQGSRGLFKSTDGGLTYTRKETGITEGDGLTIRNFQIDPTNSNIVYASAEYSVGQQGEIFDKVKGFLYKTTNGGDSWTKVYSGGSLARWMCINPANPSRMNLFTGIFDREAFDNTGDGVMHSDDAGGSWTAFNSGITGSLFVSGMAMEPDPFTGTIIIGTGQYTELQHGTAGGIFKSTNYGSTWTRVLAPQFPASPSAPSNAFTAIAFAPSNRAIVYAGNATSIYRSDDKGTTWTTQAGSPDAAWGAPGIRSGVPIEISVDRDDPNTVFINNYGGGTFVSKDAGRTWAVLGRGFTGADIHKIVVHPRSRAVAFLVGRSGPYQTTNSGTDWSGLFYGDMAQTGGEWYGATFHPTNPTIMYAADEGQAFVFRSTDGGASWRTVYHNTAITGAPGRAHGGKDIVIIGGSPETVYVGFAAEKVFSDPDSTFTNAIGIYKSSDAGATWTAKNSGLENTTLNIMSLVAGRADGSVLYAGLRGGGVFKSTNGGDSWSNITGTIAAPKGVFSLAVSPTDANTVYAGTHSGGLYKTTNGGASWSLVLAGSTTTASSAALGFEPEIGHFPVTAAATTPRIFFALAVNPTNANDVWAADWNSGIYRSTDGGANWSQLNTGLTNRTVQTLAFSADGLFVYAGTKGHGVFRFQIAAATDTAPSITTQPTNTTANSGTNVSLSVAASGTAPLSYQWFKSGALIAGATNSTLALSNVQPTNAGSYSVTVLNSAGVATSASATVTVTNPDIARLTNLSVLTDITTAVPSFTVGTVVGGAGTSGPKPLVVRAVGPSLGALGVPGTIVDPKVDLFTGQTVVASNDNWNGDSALASAMANVGAFPFAGANSKDAAIFLPSLQPRDYTVAVSGVGGATGTVIAEIYDATAPGAFTSTTPRLVNVSVLKAINPGGSLTLGFTIGGAGGRNVLVRAIGPGLSALGVPGTLADPQLTLFNSSSVAIASNDDWGADPQLIAAMTAVNAFSVGNAPTKDAMLLRTLTAGGYTARVTGNGGTSGLVIVEVYEVP